MPEFKRSGSTLSTCPPMDKWDDWTEYDKKAWPRRVKRRVMFIPTICFNCESACGLLAVLDRESGEVIRFEGNPMHPASRGRICAKGPSVLQQIHDPDRVLYPMKRVGARGDGKWERVTWDSVLSDLGSRIRKVIQEKRGEEIMYQVGRPGHDHIMERTMQAWGIDGHNSHTNICSAAARLGYVLWHQSDRPSPDYANARFILLLSAHLESGHYFNPHAQRIIESKSMGARLCVMDPRLSNTASMADDWLPTQPGTEAAVLLAMASVILNENRFNADFLRDWTNWDEMEISGKPAGESGFDSFVNHLKMHYASFTPEFAEKESGIPAATILRLAREIADAGSRFASHVWRGSASGNLGGWQLPRALILLHVLTGSVGTRGGHQINAWNKFVPKTFLTPPPQQHWNELLYPPEWPLSHHELSQLLPHFLKEGRGRIDTYFTRVFNPVWTYPDGFSWIEVLRNEKFIGIHAALTPTWNETAWYADYVLPMGMSSERHDLMSQETHASKWIGFRQPVRRVWMEKMGKRVEFTYQANPGEVWEEDEFWINLSWHIDPDGSLGIRKYFESPYRPGQRITVDEYYGWIFEKSVPGLPEAAKKEGLTPLQYMRTHGAFEVTTDVYEPFGQPIPPADLQGTQTGADNLVRKDGKVLGVRINGKDFCGFNTPSRKLEIFSSTLRDWKWPEYTLPGYIRTHVHQSARDVSIGRQGSDFNPAVMPKVDWPEWAKGNVLTLIPIFRLPVLIHTRSNNAKYLHEIAHKNPLWINPVEAARLGIVTGDLVKVCTEIGYFVLHAWVTDGLTSEVVACSHHIGRWRLKKDIELGRMSGATVDLKEISAGQWKMRQISGTSPYKTSDPDTSRIWWSDGGVHQNITFPVHPDPVSGMHCWHQVVRVCKADADDLYGDIFVDTNLAHQVYKKWKTFARSAPGPGGLRRPLWMARIARPAPEAYFMPERK